MSDEEMPERHDYGPLQTYEITWNSGHVERFQAHQVSYPDNAAVLFGGQLDRIEHIEFHGQIEGRWLLQLRARLADIRTVRNVTTTEEALS